jgi:hypothetical protein
LSCLCFVVMSLTLGYVQKCNAARADGSSATALLSEAQFVSNIAGCLVGAGEATNSAS